MTRDEMKNVQRTLRSKGFDPGPIDGLWGPITAGATGRFQKAVGLLITRSITEATLTALFSSGRTSAVKTRSAEPTWLSAGRAYLGLREYKGRLHHPTIIGWWKRLGLPYRDDETPWCAGFVCGVLEEQGIRSPRSAAARSFYWQRWGTVLNGPAVGAIASLWRNKRRGVSGHTGFVVGRDDHGNIMLLGGNQGNKVSIKAFDRKRVLSFHWPAAYPVPPKTGLLTLPLLTHAGKVSTNEQ